MCVGVGGWGEGRVVVDRGGEGAGSGWLGVGGCLGRLCLALASAEFRPLLGPVRAVEHRNDGF